MPFLVVHHYGSNYCNSEAYDDASEDYEGVFYFEKDAEEYIKEQKRIIHEENCDEDDKDCICKYRENRLHSEFSIYKVPLLKKDRTRKKKSYLNK